MMKVLAAIIAFVLVVAVVLILAAWPTMWVLGKLNASGMTYIPALGFWQTLGTMWIIGVVGGLLHGSSYKQDSSQR